MTVQEAQKFFEATEFSSETKKKIAELLHGKEVLDPYTTLEIKAAMQVELFKSLEDVDVSDTEEAKQIEKAYEDDVAEIEKNLKDNMEFVEGELKELDDVYSKLTRISDDIKADKIREFI